MTGTNCDLFTHNQSQSYLNHLVPHPINFPYTCQGLFNPRQEGTQVCDDTRNRTTALLCFTLNIWHELRGRGCRRHTREDKTQRYFPTDMIPVPPKSAGLACWNALRHRTERQVSWGWVGYAGVWLRAATGLEWRQAYTLCGQSGLLRYSVVCL
jgi:hypothetical protein